MKILLTGDKGFIGKALKKYLQLKGIEVIGYDLPENDILDELNLMSYVQKVDLVIHNAAVADLNDTFKNMNKTFDVNIRGTYNVAGACAAFKKKLVFISTCCVYGDASEIELEESTVPKTIEPYACSKMAGEYITRGMPELEYVILRIGTVYGVGMRKELFNYIALDCVENEKKMIINGNGLQSRQYVYIDDLVDGIYRACVINLKNRETINLCGFEKTSVLETVQVAQELTGKKAIYSFDMHGRYGEIKEENISTEKAFLLLDWVPKMEYFEGMKKVYEGHFHS